MSLSSRLQRLERATGPSTRAQAIAHALDVLDHMEQRTNHGQRLHPTTALALTYSVVSDDLQRSPKRDVYAAQVRAAVLARYGPEDEEACRVPSR